jgi:hypothetical protein
MASGFTAMLRRAAQPRPSTLGVHVRRARSIFSKALNFRCSDFKSNLLPDAKVAIVPAGTSFPAVLRDPFDPLLLVTRQSPSSTS